MVKGRSVLATIGSLALVLVISFPVFATEGESPTTGNEGGDPAVTTEPETPEVTDPVVEEPETPVVDEPVVEPDVPAVEPEQPTTPEKPVIVEPEDDGEEDEAPSASVSIPRSSGQRKEASKSNNTRIASITFAGIAASYGDGDFVVRDKDIDITDKSSIKVLTDNKDAKVKVSDPTISGTTATYVIEVTAVDGTKREYKLRVIKTAATVAATASTNSANSSVTAEPQKSGKGLKILIVSICVFALCSGGVFFYLKFLKQESEDLPDLSHTGGKFKKAFAWNVAKNDDNTLKADELSDADFESIRKEINND